MPKISPVDAKLVARMQHNQVEALARLEKLNKTIDGNFNRAKGDLVRIITDDRVRSGKVLAYTKAMADAVRIATDSVEFQLERLIEDQHRRNVDALMRSVPKKVWFHLAPIEYDYEEVSNQPEGYLFYDRFGGMRIIYEEDNEPFGVPTKQLVLKELNDEEKLEAIAKVLFPPPTKLQVKKILARKMLNDNGDSLGWRDRFEALSRLIDDKKIAFNEITHGYSEGENIAQIKNRLEPLVGGISASAKRIARTEGMRVAEQVQRRSWQGLGDMMSGAQIVAVLDENTRPEHATRNGTIYYNAPKGNQKSMTELPDLPDAPNCRCMSVPVLNPPEELRNDPKVREEFKLTREPGTSDSKTYDRWFAKANLAKRKSVVGVKRYKEVQDILGEARDMEWSDFIDENGSLLTITQLRDETVTQRSARKAAIDRQVKRRGKALREIGGRGFELPREKRPAKVNPLVSFVGKPRIVDRKRELAEQINETLPGLTIVKIFRLAGVPEDGFVKINAVRTKTKTQIEIATDYLAGEVSVKHVRHLVVPRKGKPFLWQRGIEVTPPGQKIGLDLFMKQVETARKLGLRKIVANADRSKKANGYWTWVRYGFDGKIPESLLLRAKQIVPGAVDVWDLMYSQTGRQFWYDEGQSFRAEFDLRPGSDSIRRLQRYHRRQMKEKRKNESYTLEEAEAAEGRKLFQNMPTVEGDPYPFGDPIEEAIFDEIADELGAEREAERLAEEDD